MPHFSHRPAARRLLLAAGTVVLLMISVLGAPDTASATAYRTWTLSGVTFADGAQATGSFRVSDTGRLDQLSITTSGGDTGTYGASTTYDETNSNTYSGLSGGFLTVITNNDARVIVFKVGDLTTASDGDVRTIDTSNSASYECLNCAPYRTVSAGSIVAGTQVGTPSITTTGMPDVNGTPQVGQTLTGDDSSMTTNPTDATRHYQWLRDGSPIAGQTATTYTVTTQDIGSYLTWEVTASKTGYDDSTPVGSAAIGPIQAAPGTPVGRIAVHVPSGLQLGGHGVTLRATGLEAGQPYSVTIAGHAVGSGTAPASGDLTRTVTVPTGIGDRSTQLRVTSPHRAGTATLRVVQAERLGLSLMPSVLHRHHRLTITVSGLAAGEHVTVRYRNRVVSPRTAHATSAGRYTYVVRVGWLAGTKTIRVTGAFRTRSASQTCQVVRHR